MPIPFPILPMSYPQRFTPSRKFTAFTHSRKTLDAVQVEAVFTQLNPVNPDLLIQGGEWHGIIMDTGHPFAEQLAHLQWRGAVFHSAEDVEPIVVDRDDKGEKATGVTDFGHASLHRVEYNHLVSTAMIFDDLPAITYFRAVNNRMVAGVMESKSFGQAGKFYFYLVR